MDGLQSSSLPGPLVRGSAENLETKATVGIFSLFGKKDVQKKKAAAKDGSRTRHAASGSRPEKKGSVRRDAGAAQATVLKIDAIESEMSSEFVTVKAPSRTRNAKALPSEKKQAAQAKATAPAETVPATLQPTTGMGSTTDFLLHGNSTVDDVAAPASGTTAVIEECAIMYANGQVDLVEQMLLGAIAEDTLGDATRPAWWMLFDLYQLAGKREPFEQLAIEYANKFEASPPGWIDAGEPEAAAPLPEGSPPLVSFSGALDAKAARITERVKKLAESHRALRLEFVRVSKVEREGCALLLAALRQLQKSGHELVLVGARELADQIRAMLEVGRRTDGEECWLLLLEILRLLNCEKEFEEASIDYCVTFEVSPPAFVAPQATVTTASSEQVALPGAEGLPMPRLVEGRIDNLIVAIAAYSDEHLPAIIDCSRLERVDFNAAGRLLTGLAPFCGSGKQIEFHHVNHLVAELFHVIGLDDIVRVIPRKS